MTLATRTARWPVVLRDHDLRASGDLDGSQGSALTRLDIQHNQRTALRDAVALLAQDCLLVVFPEGYPNVDPHYTPKTTHRSRRGKTPRDEGPDCANRISLYEESPLEGEIECREGGLFGGLWLSTVAGSLHGAARRRTLDMKA